MKQIKPETNLKQLQLLSEASEEVFCGGRTTTGRVIVIHTSCGDDII